MTCYLFRKIFDLNQVILLFSLVFNGSMLMSNVLILVSR